MKLTKVLYIPQASKSVLSLSRLVSKGAMMGATQEKMTIKKNGVSMILDARKSQNKIMVFYLKAKRYALEVKEAITNIPEDKKCGNDKNKNDVRVWSYQVIRMLMWFIDNHIWEKSCFLSLITILVSS